MIRTRKYLVLTGTVLIVIILLIFSNQNRSNKKEEISKDNTYVNESTITGNSSTNNINENATMYVEKNNSDNEEAADNQDLSRIDKETETEINKLITKYYDNSIEINKDLLIIDEPGKEDQTTESIKKKRVVIEEYKNINTYVKPGLEADTYVVFSNYDTKLININTLVPGMSLLYVTKDVNGNLRINNNSPDDKLSNYFEQLTNDEDIKKMIKEVNSKLSDAISKDNSLEKFIGYLETLS